MIEAILDTVVMSHLLRKPHPKGAKKKKKKKTSNAFSITEMDAFFQKKTLKIVADVGRGLISEWERTCGVEEVKQLVIRWTDKNGIELINVSAPIPNAVAKLLVSLGFDDVVDKLIVRTALQRGTQTRIVSIDSDFWDPADPNEIGNSNAPVAKLLRDQLNLTVWITSQFIAASRREPKGSP